LVGKLFLGYILRFSRGPFFLSGRVNIPAYNNYSVRYLLIKWDVSVDVFRVEKMELKKPKNFPGLFIIECLDPVASL
jgi:hypothetical protein